MSDTPRVDAVCGWAMGYRGPMASGDLIKNVDAPFVHSTFARQLERELSAAIEENAQLHTALDSYYNGEQLRVLRDCVDRTGKANDRLVVENAALRKDKERLDWLVTPDGTEWLTWQHVAGKPTDGAAIDAARKEVQP